MILLALWIVLAKTLVIEVDFNGGTQWSHNQQSTYNSTFQISSSKENYIYVKVTLSKPNANLYLVSQELSAVSNLSNIQPKDGSTIDYISVLENRKTRFLKISQSNFPLYISTIDLIKQSSYSIIIETSSEEKCDSDCSNNGICKKDGCECYKNFVGTDCNTLAQQIDVKNDSELQLSNQPIFFYIDLGNYKGQSLELQISTQDQNGIFIYIQKSLANYIPNSENYDKNLIQLETVFNQMPLQLIIGNNDDEQDARLVFAALVINQSQINITPIYLEISLTCDSSDKQDNNTVSSTIIIVVVICIVIAIIIIIILFCIFKKIRRRREMELIARQREDNYHASNKQPAEHIDSNLIEIKQDEINPDETCSICFENQLNGKELCQTQCKHNFHRECILAWIAKHQECPICKKILQKKKIEVITKIITKFILVFVQINKCIIVDVSFRVRIDFQIQLFSQLRRNTKILVGQFIEKPTIQ